MSPEQKKKKVRRAAPAAPQRQAKAARPQKGRPAPAGKKKRPVAKRAVTPGKKKTVTRKVRPAGEPAREARGPLKKKSKIPLLIGIVLVPVILAAVYIQFFGPEEQRVKDIRNVDQLKGLATGTKDLIQDRVKETSTAVKDNVIPVATEKAEEMAEVVKDDLAAATKKMGEFIEVAASKLMKWRQERQVFEKRLVEDKEFKEEFEKFETDGIDKFHEEIMASAPMVEEEPEPVPEPVPAAPRPRPIPDGDRPKPVAALEELTEEPKLAEELKEEAVPESEDKLEAVAMAQPDGDDPMPDTEILQTEGGRVKIITGKLPPKPKRKPPTPKETTKTEPKPKREPKSGLEGDKNFAEGQKKLSEAMEWYKKSDPVAAGSNRNKYLKQTLVRLDAALKSLQRCVNDRKYQGSADQEKIHDMMQKTNFLRYACMKSMTL